MEINQNQNQFNQKFFHKSHKIFKKSKKSEKPRAVDAIFLMKIKIVYTG